MTKRMETGRVGRSDIGDEICKEERWRTRKEKRKMRERSGKNTGESNNHDRERKIEEIEATCHGGMLEAANDLQ